MLSNEEPEGTFCTVREQKKELANSHDLKCLGSY